jgi:branched-chain amino acid transport system substrate-binding protein
VVIALTATKSIAIDNTFKIGLILPMTGQQASTGRQIEAAARLYMAQNGDTVAGKKILLVVKDDTTIPDVTKRLAQELVVNDKVDVLAGFGITPSALATAPIATQSKTPMVVMAAATSSITQASPYIVRTSFTLAQASVVMGDWAPKPQHFAQSPAQPRSRPTPKPGRFSQPTVQSQQHADSSC